MAEVATLLGRAVDGVRRCGPGLPDLHEGGGREGGREGGIALPQSQLEQSRASTDPALGIMG
jgi:hypothetical protein